MARALMGALKNFHFESAVVGTSLLVLGLATWEGAGARGR
jgi:hypothetical protein